MGGWEGGRVVGSGWEGGSVGGWVGALNNVTQGTIDLDLQTSQSVIVL